MLLLIIRALLQRENRRRDAEPPKEEEEYFIEIIENGKPVEVKVEKVSDIHLCMVDVFRADVLATGRNSWTLQIARIVISDMSCREDMAVFSLVLYPGHNHNGVHRNHQQVISWEELSKDRNKVLATGLT